MRVPNEDKIVTLAHPGLRADDVDAPITEVIDFDGHSYLGAERVGGESRYLKIFKAYPDFQAISHVHAPSLGAYSQAHAKLPLLNVHKRLADDGSGSTLSQLFQKTSKEAMDRRIPFFDMTVRDRVIDTIRRATRNIQIMWGVQFVVVILSLIAFRK